MRMPSFTAEAALYGTHRHHHMVAMHMTSIDTGQVVPALPSCASKCGYETGTICNCPPGQQCMQRCPINCFIECFLWWCWRRCEKSELCESDLFCQ